jgi:hypothetical protein
MSDEHRKISPHTEKLAGELLFQRPTSINPKIKNDAKKKEALSDSSKFMDIRSNLNTKEMMKAVMYYGGLSIGYQSDQATEYKDFLERILCSYQGLAREQGTEVLKQQFPKKVEVDRGSDTYQRNES